MKMFGLPNGEDLQNFTKIIYCTWSGAKNNPRGCEKMAPFLKEGHPNVYFCTNENIFRIKSYLSGYVGIKAKVVRNPLLI